MWCVVLCSCVHGSLAGRFRFYGLSFVFDRFVFRLLEAVLSFEAMLFVWLLLGSACLSLCFSFLWSALRLVGSPLFLSLLSFLAFTALGSCVYAFLATMLFSIGIWPEWTVAVGLQASQKG